MTCPRCEHHNDDGARFCSNCGLALQLRCPSCETAYEAGANFCSNCGTSLPSADTGAQTRAGPDDGQDDLSRYVPDELLRKIKAARSGQAMRGERRTVTMLFADIQGSTAAAEHLDPEEWAEIMNGAFGHLIEPVYRYEGTLARLQGDAILAFFGAPIAHEDDPVRAVRAGLDIISDVEPYAREVEATYGVPIGVRVGINTGLVVVGEVGSDLRVEYTALGDAINVAARMEQTAEPGTVRVTDHTLQLLGAGFESEPIGPVDVKGKSDPVQAHRVVRWRAEAGDAAGARTPLVGRAQELAVLTEAVARLDDGIGAIRSVTGEAGIGKSRLVDALHADISTTHRLVDAVTDEGGLAWLRGGPRSYERSIPHAAFVGMLCRWWATGSIPGDACFERVDGALAAAIGERDPDTAGILTHLVGAEVPEEQQRLIDAFPAPVLHERRTEAVAAYLEAEAHRRPLVVVLDDVHWADDVSLTLTERLMQVSETAPLVLVMVLRPARDEPVWQLIEAAERDHAHRHEMIELDALGGDATEALLDELLGDARVDDELRDAILERSNGNPLFIEELIRSLADDELTSAEAMLGRNEVHLPASLTGLLTSRLDRLADATRHVAHVASVIGREFDVDTLSATVDDPSPQLEAHLQELVRRGIVEERRRHPTPVYAFRHPLIQETAYNTVLLRTRRTLHGRVAAHLADHDPDAVHEIAHHHVEAGDTAAAFPYLIEAGQRATRAMALRDAIRAFSTALDAPPDDADPELMMAAHDGLGQAYAMVPDLTHTAAAYQSLLDYGRQTDRPAMQVAALNRLAFNTAALSGDFDGAMGFLGEARALAEEVGDDMGLAEYHQTACYIEAFRGELDRAVEHDDATARIGQQAGNHTVRLTGLLRRTTNLAAAGRLVEARDSYDEAMEAARAMGSDEAAAVLDAYVATALALGDGDVNAAVNVLRQALPVLDRYTSYYGAGAHHRFGECAAYAGDVEAALAAYAATERYGRSLSQPFAVSAGASGRARILARCGMRDDLADLRTQAVELVEATGEFFSPSVWTDLAEVGLAVGDLAGCDEDLDRAVSASGITAFWERPRIRFCRARLGLARGELETTRSALDVVREFVAEHRIQVHEPELFVLDGAVAAAEGRDADAVTLLTQAAASAAESGRAPIRIEALSRLAGVRSRSGDAQEARALRERARAATDELAGLIVDAELRAAFHATLSTTTAVVDDLG